MPASPAELETLKDFKFKRVHDLYHNIRHVDEYGDSLIMLAVITLAWLILLGMLFFAKTARYYKARWATERCKVAVMPFAGVINAPDGTSATDYTVQNFQFCTDEMIKSMSKVTLEPVELLAEGLQDLYAAIADAIATIENVLNRIVKSIEAIVQGLVNRVMNVVVIVQKIAIKIVDSFKKMQAALVTGLYVLISFFDTIVSAAKVMINASIGQLMLTLAAIVSMIGLSFVFPFLIPLVVILVLIFTSMSIPLALIVVFLVDVLKIPQTEFPKIPAIPSLHLAHRGLHKK